MTERIVEGSNSVLVRTLTDSIAIVLAETDPGAVDRFAETFKQKMFSQLGVTRQPRYARHIAEILERLQFQAQIAIAAKDPAYIVIQHPVANGVNEPAKPAPVEGNYDDLFDLIDPPAAPPEDVSIDDAIDGLVNKPAEDTVLEPMRGIIEEYVTKRTHPFVRVFKHDYENCGYRFVAVGTCVGKSKRNPNATFNANCTTQNYRKIKDLPESILVHRNGRPVTLCHETPDGGRFFLWLLHHKPGLELRFWINVNEPGKPRADVESGNCRLRLTDDAQGWQKV